MNALKKSFNHGGHDKGKFSNKSELIQLREYLKTHIVTATMAAIALNIYRPNVCRYKRELQKNNALIVVGKGICRITKHRAEYLSCNMGGLQNV